jgi:hypothetical protein
MNVIGLFQRKGHTCTFTIEFESLSCLIQQQQPLQPPPPPPQQPQQQQQQQQSLPPSRKSLLSGFKIANNIGQMIDDAIGGLMGDIDRAPPTGVLRKNVVICWKRGKKKYVCLCVYIYIYISVYLPIKICYVLLTNDGTGRERYHLLPLLIRQHMHMNSMVFNQISCHRFKSPQPWNRLRNREPVPHSHCLSGHLREKNLKYR